MKIILIAIIVISLLLIIIYPHKLASLTWSDGDYIESNLDNNTYRVINGFNNMDTAADKLSSINIFNESLISYLNHKCDDGHCNARQQSILYNLQNRYDSATLMENNPSTTVNTSYTQFKGKIIAVCLREKESGQNRFEDDNTLQFVSLHELGHVSSNSYGHNDEFWNNFEALLHIAADDAKIYEPVDYSKYPLKYCGVNIYTNPYFERGRRSSSTPRIDI